MADIGPRPSAQMAPVMILHPMLGRALPLFDFAGFCHAVLPQAAWKLGRRSLSIAGKHQPHEPQELLAGVVRSCSRHDGHL